jgi:hypothetical protein
VLLTIHETCPESPDVELELKLFNTSEISVCEKRDDGQETLFASIEIWDGELRVLAWKEGEDEPVVVTIRSLK